jgi:aminoglycoside phosphotransferase (APT) family kinase protein
VSPPRVERLDPHRMAAAVRERTGVDLVVERLSAGGQVGAAYVRGPDGRRGVLTWVPGRTLAELEAGPLAVLGSLRRTGYPAPRIELAAEVDGAVVLVQELLPGAGPQRFSGGLLDQALALNDRQAGALAGHPAVPAVELHLAADGPGFCLHGPLREHDRRTRRLEAWVREVAAGHPDGLPGDDAVHLDFHPGNLLVDADRITGVVDWGGAGRGDRRLDLVTLRFAPHEPDVAERLDEILDGLPPDVLRPAWAHMSLRMVDWAIRHHTPADVERWIDLAEQRAT